MAKNPKDRLNEILLFTFVIISIALVAVQWIDGIWGEEEDLTPGFVRPTFENFEVGEDAYENWNQIEVTPTMEHRNTPLSEGTPTPNH